MTLLRNHLVLMFIYAAATAVYFALLWKPTREERIRFFFLVFCSLFFGGIALGWLMYPFPLK